MERAQKNEKYQCACCLCYTIFREFDICPVCYWEANWYQEEHDILDDAGPNRVSIIDGRKNYIKFHACEERFVNQVRLPLTDELSD